MEQVAHKQLCNTVWFLGLGLSSVLSFSLCHSFLHGTDMALVPQLPRVFRVREAADLSGTPPLLPCLQASTSLKGCKPGRIVAYIPGGGLLLPLQGNPADSCSKEIRRWPLVCEHPTMYSISPTFLSILIQRKAFSSFHSAQWYMKAGPQEERVPGAMFGLKFLL